MSLGMDVRSKLIAIDVSGVQAEKENILKPLLLSVGDTSFTKYMKTFTKRLCLSCTYTEYYTESIHNQNKEQE